MGERLKSTEASLLEDR